MILGAEKILKKITRLECKRIILRSFTRDDAADVLEYASDAETVKWLVWEGVTDIESALKALNEFNIPTAGVYAITLRENGKCIGCIDLRLNMEHEKADFGYVLNKKFWNKGYTSEALDEVLRLAFEMLELNRVESTHYIGNEASGRVMEKCGMNKEGVALQEVKIKGVFHDVVHYGILRKDWMEKGAKG